MKKLHSDFKSLGEVVTPIINIYIYININK